MSNTQTSTVSINATMKALLQKLGSRTEISGGKAAGYDKRTINALEKRGFVKVETNKKGTFAQATAAGRKQLS